MARKNPPTGGGPGDEQQEPVVRDRRRIDPETGEVRREADATATGSEDGDTASVESVDDLTAAEGPDVEVSMDDAPPAGAADAVGADDGVSDADRALLDEAERDLVAEYRERAARAEAELKNFRTRVERDRQANREAVIVEVIRSLLPAIDDLARAEAHGDVPEGSALAVVAAKLRGGFERYGLRSVGEKGEPFDPKLHEAIVQLPSADVDYPTVADVVEIGYALGDRLVRAAKVAVSVPQ